MDAEQQKASKVPVWKHWRFFPRAMLEVAKVMEFGASKPGRKAGGWTEQSAVSDTYFDDPLIRHMIDREISGECDSESHLLHLAHRACNAMMALEMELRKRENEEEWNAVLNPGDVIGSAGVAIELYDDRLPGQRD